jgi:long-chain acyl-CoA synthetase
MFLSEVNNANNVALIESNGNEVTYSDLYKCILEFSNFFAGRHLIFIIGESDLATIVSYLSSIESNIVPLLLSSKINNKLLANLIDIYKPKYIFKKKSKPYKGFQALSTYKGYSLFIGIKYEEIKLHNDLALLLTTSGSTGSPKLVRLTKKNLLSNAKSICSFLQITSNDRAISSLPFNYSYGLSVINSHLSCGGSIVLSNTSMMERDFWNLIKKHLVTSIAGVPYNYEMILRLGIEKLELTSVKKMTQAGGRLNSKKIDIINQSLSLKNINFYIMYGQTEATARIAYLPPEDINRKLGGIGKPIPGGKLWIEDINGNIIDKNNVIGELVYSGENVSMGYADSLKDLELGDSNSGTLKTGDLARFDNEGYFFIEGSNNRFVKLFGNRISLDSVEKIVLDNGFENVVTGNAKKIDIYVIDSQSLSLEMLRAKISEVIGINKIAINVNKIDEFPRLNNGKIDYSLLGNS